MSGRNLDVESESGADPGAIALTHAGSRSDDPAEGHDGKDPLLDLLEQWDEHYGRGEDVAPESLGITDPVLLAELCERIKKQKWLYEHLRLEVEPTDGAAGVDESSPSFPGHETLGKIGQGGMGVVYKARDLKLGRVVAIKTIAEAHYATREQLDRFVAEAEAVARLQHPHIIQIHAIDEHEGRPYFSLEFAEGGNLAQRLAQGPMTGAGAAELVETLARAVHFAHLAGIVHRDLKPSNVLLTADGSPKVSDFGLAKLMDRDSARTLSGDVLGTPSYMAPEQAGGHSKEVGPAADIYALGAILYQALTGRPPFLGGSAIETLNLVVSTEVVAPRRLRPEVPRDLETICLKCLQKEPAKRYASAQALADDLRLFLNGRPIFARPVSPWERSWRWCRRNPKLATVSTSLAATVLIAVSAFVGLTYRHNVQLRAEVRKTDAKAAEARRNYQEAGSTIQSMLSLLENPGIEGVPRLLELRRDQREAALAFYERILNNIDSNDSVVLMDTIRALGPASVLQHQLGHTDRAKEDMERALSLIDSLRTKRPDATELLRLEIDAQIKLGNYVMFLGQHDRALRCSRKSVELAESLVSGVPDDPSYQELLAICYHFYANLMFTSKFNADAMTYYKKSAAIRERIDPSRLPGVTNRLAETVMSEGLVLWHVRQNAAAEERFRFAEKLLVSLPPEQRDTHGNVAIILGQLNVNWGGMLHTTGRDEEAVARADAGLSRIEPHLKNEPSDAPARDLCLKLHGNRAYALMGLGKHRESAAEWIRVVELSPEPVPAECRVRLAMELVQADEFARALAQVQFVKSAQGLSGDDCYNVGCVYALVAAADRKDPSVSPADRDRLVGSHITDAMRWLKSAADLGSFRDQAERDYALKDTDLAILADRFEFRKLIEAEAAKPANKGK